MREEIRQRYERWIGKPGEKIKIAPLTREDYFLGGILKQMREMVDANYIRWIGNQGRYQEAIEECDRAILYCIEKNTLNTLAGIYYMKAFYQEKMWKENSELLFQKKERIELDYIICALLAKMIEDEKGLKLALFQLEELEN